MINPRGGGRLRRYVRENKPSWDFVDNGDPVITAAATSECHKNDLVQWQRNPVGGDIVLDVVCDAPAEGLNGETEQSSLDSNTVPSWGVPFPLRRTLDEMMKL